MKRLACTAILLVLAASCSVSSFDNRLPAKCIRAHDEYHNEGMGGATTEHIVTLCDEYAPATEQGER